MVELLLAIAAVGGAIAALAGSYAAIVSARTRKAHEETKEIIVRVEHATNGMKAELERLAYKRGERDERARHKDE